MFEQLSNNEREALDFIKKEFYDRTKSTSIATVQPKLAIKTEEDVMTSLQQKGFWIIKKADFGNNMEMVSITFKDAFFKYYNISMY